MFFTKSNTFYYILLMKHERETQKASSLYSVGCAQTICTYLQMVMHFCLCIFDAFRQFCLCIYIYLHCYTTVMSCSFIYNYYDND